MTKAAALFPWPRHVIAVRTLRWQLCVWAGHTQFVGDLNPAVLHLQQGGTPTCGELGIREFLGRRLQTSMTHATVEASTAGLGQTVRTKRPLVGGLSFDDVSGMWTSPLAHRLPRGIQAQSVWDVCLLLRGSANYLRPERPGWRSVVNSEDPT